jgi:hypothetical protein
MSRHNKIKMKLVKEHYTITDFSKPDPLLRRLYDTVRATLWPGMDRRFFLHFYLSSKPHRMQITFLQAGGEDVGFFTCTYAFQQLQGKQTAICRVAIGVLPDYQKGAMPFAGLSRRIIAYKLRYPFRPVYMVAYLANPLVYSSIAKGCAEYWPTRHKKTPASIISLKDSILAVGNLKKHEVAPFVLKIHFPVHLSPRLLDRIYASNDPDVKFYLAQGVNIQQQMGLMTIVPVRWANIAANIWKAMIIRPLKKAGFRFDWLLGQLIDAVRYYFQN